MSKPIAIVMVGAPGSGKSTLADQLAEEYDAVIIDGDDIRTDLWGNPHVMGSYIEFADELARFIEGYVPDNLILDGSYCKSDERKETIYLLESYGYRVKAYVLDAPLSTCLERNFRRPYPVPQRMVEKHHEDLQRSIDSIDSEGFDEVLYQLVPAAVSS